MYFTYFAVYSLSMKLTLSSLWYNHCDHCNITL
uniref:Uncharacterized protein n=1 Tax=Anguilla anguilla TaxID=7936 RepID=A0A0E9QPI9_ANGAN